ncbi:MAG TPA: hypothetical protein VHA09_02295, partial [Nitrososphaera sp.]|nr:hypothetical protein [Nitrososphaera sp.]
MSEGENKKELGIIVGVAKPDNVRFESRRPVSVGEYVVMHNCGEKILALVERSFVKSDALGDGIRNYDEASESLQVAAENKRDKSYKADARIIGYLEKLRKCKAVMPALPPEPGTLIY